MDARLVAKIESVERLARDCGWDTARNADRIDGMEVLQLVGTTVRGHPEAAHGLTFGFSVAFGVSPDTGRVQAMRFDGKDKAVFVMTLEDGSGRYWYGPLSAHKRALDDPESWTGVLAPAPISR